MQYFINAQARKATQSTQYFELAKRHYRGKHWSADSIFIHMDEFDRLELGSAFQLVAEFDYCGPTVINREQWGRLLEQLPQLGQEAAEALQEADAWVQECLAKHQCFTLLGM